MVSSSENIEKPMSETTIQERTEKEKRQREEPESDQPQETAKRRELSPHIQESPTAKGEPSAVKLSTKSGFATATGFASVASTSSIFDQPHSKETTSGVVNDENHTSNNSTDTPKDSRTVPKSGFASATGFGGFASSGGFSSFNSSQPLSGGFSSLLDTSNSRTSIFDTPASTAASQVKSAKQQDDEESNDEQDPAEVVDEEQYVAVKGLEKTDVPTGEETETCIHQIRAKLFAISPNNTAAGWKERGVGTLRVLQLDSRIHDNNPKSRTRLVMRADAVLRVILNMPIHHNYILQPGGESMGEKTIRIFGIEDSVGTWLAIRVGSEKAADELKDVIEECMNKSAESAAAAVAATTTTTTRSGSEIEDDLEVNGETAETHTSETEVNGGEEQEQAAPQGAEHDDNDDDDDDSQEEEEEEDNEEEAEEDNEEEAEEEDDQDDHKAEIKQSPPEPISHHSTDTSNPVEPVTNAETAKSPSSHTIESSSSR